MLISNYSFLILAGAGFILFLIIKRGIMKLLTLVAAIGVLLYFISQVLM